MCAYGICWRSAYRHVCGLWVGFRGEGAQPAPLHTAASWTEPSNFFRRSGTSAASLPSAVGAFNLASNIVLDRRSSFSDLARKRPARTGTRSGATSNMTVGHRIHNPSGRRSAHDPVSPRQRAVPGAFPEELCIVLNTDRRATEIPVKECKI